MESFLKYVSQPARLRRSPVPDASVSSVRVRTSENVLDGPCQHVLQLVFFCTAVDLGRASDNTVRVTRKRAAFDCRHGQRKGASSWKRRGPNRLIKQSSVHGATEAPDGSAEDVEENMECSSSLVMNFLHARIITASREVGSYRTTCTRDVSLVCPMVVLIEPSPPKS